MGAANAPSSSASSWRSLIGVLPASLVLILLFGGGLAEAFLGGVTALGGVLNHPDFWPGFWLTLRTALLTTLLSAIIATLFALALRALPKTRWAKVPRLLIQVPLPIPHLVVGLTMLLFLSPTGFLARITQTLGLAEGALPALTNDAYGLGIALTYLYKEAPFVCVLVLSSLRGPTQALELAARNLGASKLYTFWHVTLPAMAPSLRLGSVLVFAYTFGAFEVPLLLGRTRPSMLGVFSWQLYSNPDLSLRPLALAAAMIILFVSLLFAALLFGLPRAFAFSRHHTLTNEYKNS